MAARSAASAYQGIEKIKNVRNLNTDPFLLLVYQHVSRVLREAQEPQNSKLLNKPQDTFSLKNAFLFFCFLFLGKIKECFMGIFYEIAGINMSK